MINAGAKTWAGFATEVFVQSAAHGGPSVEVEAITTGDYPAPGSRPANSSLNTDRFTRTFGHRLVECGDGVKRFAVASRS